MNKHLTLRGMIVGILGLVVITASSMYVALRMGALPWPTIFVTVVSMAALGKAKNSSLQEINVTHTIMSSGAMVAGGLAFTLPGLWILDPDASFSTLPLIILAVVGAILGTLFSAIFRKKLIIEEELPYPMGLASYNTLQASIKGGHGAKTLFASMGGSVIFTALRDGFGKIPALLTLFKGTALFPAFSIWVSPMAMGIGAIIGPLFALIWFGGALLGYYLLIPVGLGTGLFASMADANTFRLNLGIGLMIGTGLGVFIKAIISRVQNAKKRKTESKVMATRTKGMIFTVLFFAIILLAVGTDISLTEAVIVIVGIYLTTYLSGMLTGQTGINPMEIFGILVLLVVQLVSHPSLVASFSIAAVTAVACGLTGDVMNDLKSGYLLGTDTRQQILGEGIGGVIGAVLSVFVLLIMKASFGGFGTLELPAPQAAAVAAMVGGLSHVPAFIAGSVIGILLYLKSKLPSATLGLGVYLPIHISSIMAFGAIISSLLKKIFSNKYSTERLGEESGLIASGLLGGEGITGVVIAIISMLK